MTIITDFDLFDIVFLKTDQDQKERMVVELRVLPGNLIIYEVQSGTDTSFHYREELTTEKNGVKILDL